MSQNNMLKDKQMLLTLIITLLVIVVICLLAKQGNDIAYLRDMFSDIEKVRLAP